MEINPYVLSKKVGRLIPIFISWEFGSETIQMFIVIFTNFEKLLNLNLKLSVFFSFIFLNILPFFATVIICLNFKRHGKRFTH